MMVVGLHELRSLLGTYQQFVSCFCNDILSSNVRKSLWNSPVTLINRSENICSKKQ